MCPQKAYGRLLLRRMGFCETEGFGLSLPGLTIYPDGLLKDLFGSLNIGLRRRSGMGPSIGRHRRNCSICAHPRCEEIETAYIGWASPAAIAEEYGLSDRSSVYRHAHALGLKEKRKRNIRAALERIIEKAGEVDVTASAVVSAIQAYSKINAVGQWIDRSEQVSLNDLFDRMTTQELEAYAQDGSLPGWFQTATLSATPVGSQE
jgi:hypothetical protein